MVQKNDSFSVTFFKYDLVSRYGTWSLGHFGSVSLTYNIRCSKKMREHFIWRRKDQTFFPVEESNAEGIEKLTLIGKLASYNRSLVESIPVFTEM